MLPTPRTGYRGLCLVIVTLVAGNHLAPAANRARGDDLAGFGVDLAVAGDFMVIEAANDGNGAAHGLSLAARPHVA